MGIDIDTEINSTSLKNVTSLAFGLALQQTAPNQCVINASIILQNLLCT